KAHDGNTVTYFHDLIGFSLAAVGNLYYNPVRVIAHRTEIGVKVESRVSVKYFGSLSRAAGNDGHVPPPVCPTPRIKKTAHRLHGFHIVSHEGDLT
ncbi:MAG: hypothetical protein R6V38_05570, partial [Roseovarius gahaiensis]